MSELFRGPHSGHDGTHPEEPHEERDHLDEVDYDEAHHEQAYEGQDYVRADELHGASAEPLDTRRTSRVSKRVRKRRRSLVFLVIFVAFCAVVFFVFQSVRPMLGSFQVSDYPGPGTGQVEVVVGAGATARIVAAELKSLDVVASEKAFLEALNEAGGTGSIQPGTFSMKSQMKASDAVSILLTVVDDRVHYAAVAQNLRIGEVLDVLAKSSGVARADFAALANAPAAFDLPPQAKNLEGYLAPGEYRFPIDVTAKEILTQMVDTTKKALVDAGVKDPAEQYRVLTIASIIEFEGNEANYAQISGAIENRINNPNGETRGFLESDATVVYGLGIKSYEFTPEQRADKSNPYNTFANPGLPVGPIGSPGSKAIAAAAKPESNPYYFWVTVNLKTGETLFATTYAEHQLNVAKYSAWCQANAGECK